MVEELQKIYVDIFLNWNLHIANLRIMIDHHIEEEIIERLKAAGKENAGLVTYAPPEPMTTIQKLVNVDKAVRDLDLKSTISIEEGIPNTIEWMKKAYNV